MWCSGSIETLTGEVMFGSSNEGEEARVGHVMDSGKVL